MLKDGKVLGKDIMYYKTIWYLKLLGMLVAYSIPVAFGLPYWRELGAVALMSSFVAAFIFAFLVMVFIPSVGVYVDILEKQADVEVKSVKVYTDNPNKLANKCMRSQEFGMRLVADVTGLDNPNTIVYYAEYDKQLVVVGIIPMEEQISME